MNVRCSLYLTHGYLFSKLCIWQIAMLAENIIYIFINNCTGKFNGTKKLRSATHCSPFLNVGSRRSGGRFHCKFVASDGKVFKGNFYIFRIFLEYQHQPGTVRSLMVS